MADIERVHHLDCCTMCPAVGFGDGEHLVAHVVAIETGRSGIVLVDTGIGDAARADPNTWLGRPFTAFTRPDRDPARSAAAQLRALELDPADVRHIVVTHLDLDHAGGLVDFPNATVHVHRDELDAAFHPRPRERSRYRKIQWRHQPRWAAYERTGEPWFGFDAVHDLDGLPPGILAIPLPGHTRGHAAVAIDAPGGWLLHAGDAYFRAETVDPTQPAGPKVLRLFEPMVAVDRARVATNHERLADLVASHGPGAGPPEGGDLVAGGSGAPGASRVTVFSAHDRGEFERLRARTAAPG